MNPVIVINSSDDEKQSSNERKNSNGTNGHETEFERLEKAFEEFVLMCSTVIEQTMDSKGKKILEYFKKRHTTRTSKELRNYRKLLQWCNKRMKKGDDRIFVFIKDALHALDLSSTTSCHESSALKKRKLSPAPDDNNSPSIPLIPNSENNCQPSTSTSDAAQSVSEHHKLDTDVDVGHTSRSTTSETVTLSPRKPTTKIRIKKLESYLKSLSKEIIRLQSAEIAISDMDKEDSSYIQEGQLKERFMKTYRRLCELKQSKVITGRHMEKRIKIKSSDYPSINRKIERFINSSKRKKNLPEPSVIFRLVRKASTKNELNLSEKLLRETSEKIFMEVGQKMQKRRHRDFIYEFGCSAVDDENTDVDPASSNGALQDALNKNREVAELSRLLMNNNKFQRMSRDSDDLKQITLSEKASRFVKKCDSLCAPEQRSNALEEFWSIKENSKNLYAIVPPMDKFMDVEESESLDYIWNGFERGDLIIVRIASIRETGFTGVLLAMDGGRSKHITHSIYVWCPVNEIPKKTNHEDVLLQFSAGDLVRCTIINVKSELIVSIRKHKHRVPLGKIEEEDLPLAYQRSLTASESYENILKKCVGFINPSSVEYLLKGMSISSGLQMSLMKDLRYITISRKEYAESIRKQQSKKVADVNVKRGIKHFKDKEYELALQNFNYALDMDTDNVDGLVARGALYANRTCFAKAIRDFDVALKLEPGHKNAKKYLTEVLVERARQIESQIEDVEQIREVKRCYQKALSIDPNCEEAKKALGQIEEKQQKSAKSDTSSNSESDQYASTAKKLKDILENDVSVRKRRSSQAESRRKKRKRRESSSSSSTSSSSTSTASSSSSDEREMKNTRQIRGKMRSHSLESKETDSRRKSRGSPSSCNIGPSSRKSAPHDLTRRKSTNDPCTSNHSKTLTEGRSRAVIHSNQSAAPYEKPSRKPRRSSSDIKNITKDNIKDILLEISMFETTKKTK